MHLLLSGASPGSICLSNFHLIWLEPLPALHICRHRCCKVNLVSTDRMGKCKSPGMEQWSFFPKSIWVVQKISNQRMSNCLHMHPDLMSSSCLQLTFYQCLIRSCFQHFVMSHCPFSMCFVNAALDHRFCLPTDRQINGSAFLKFTRYHRQIGNDDESQSRTV